MNTFYGKPVNTMNFAELTLLSVDIQISSFEHVNNIPQHFLEQSFKIRESLMYKCQDCGGIYTREQFLNDFNNTKPHEIDCGFTDFVEINNPIYLN